MSLNGIVREGTWRYMNEAKSILIDRGNNDKILVNNAFFDSAVMILKYDGANNENLFILANQNVIPNLDVEAYLNSKVKKKFEIEKFHLTNDKKLEIFSTSDTIDKIGCDVLIDGNIPLDCEVEDGYSKFYIQNGKINKISYPRKVTLSNGNIILIEQASYYSPLSGDLVFIQGNPAPSGKYKLGFFDYLLVIEGVMQ
jgi:hypothetical protein